MMQNHIMQNIMEIAVREGKSEKKGCLNYD